MVKSAKLIVANWKMNGTNAAVMQAIKHYASTPHTNQKNVVLALPTVYLAQARTLMTTLDVSFTLASQDVSQFYDHGAFTGEVSATMLKEFAIEYAIIGHSERRTLLDETSPMVLAKIDNALSSAITPVFCIGESKHLRDTKQYSNYLLEQLALLRKVKTPFNEIVIAYEPIWSIGTGLIPSDDEISEVMRLIHIFIHNDLPHVKMSALYGGSVAVHNAANILQLAGVDGVLVGGASLKVDDFSAIVASIPPAF